jgi:hypothetical protein
MLSNFYKDISLLHKKYIEKQKNLFKNLKYYDEANEAVYAFLTTKFNNFTDAFVEKLKNYAIENNKLIASDKEVRKRLGVIKAHMNHQPSFKLIPIEAPENIGYEVGKIQFA